MSDLKRAQVSPLRATPWLLSLALAPILGCASATNGADSDAEGDESPDASLPSRADAAPGVLPDAGVTVSYDAALPAADAATGCTPAALNLLNNADFDLGPSGWVEDSAGGFALITDAADITGVDADSGSFVSWLGGYEPGLLSASDIFHQDLVVPGDATPMTISGKLWISTAETLFLPFDTLALEIVNASTGSVLETVDTWSNLDAGTGWKPFSATLSGSYAGQNIRVRWTADMDATKASHFLLDTLSLATTSCP